MNIKIIDYGVGNLFSLASSLAAIGADAEATRDIDKLKTADRLILPGVGAFGDAAAALRATGMADLVREQAAKGVPLMGICLGMQLLFDKSYEYGEFEGLGLIPGQVRALEEICPPEQKVPHIGWNLLRVQQETPIFKYTKDGDYVYFVHSFYADTAEENIVAKTEYGAAFAAAVQKGNVCGCQFHPEKSGEVGLSILKAFCEM